MSEIKPTDEQQQAISASTSSDMLIVAGAGSGKTFTMTRRVKALIDKGVPANRILGLTFTNKAAAELLSRVSAMLNEGERSLDKLMVKPDVMTYDAFFQSIVRQYGLLVGFDQSVQPLSQAGAFQLVEPLVAHYMIEHQELIASANVQQLCKQTLGLSADIASSMIGVDACGNQCSSMASAIEKCRQWNQELIDQLERLLSSAGDCPQTKCTLKALGKQKAKESDEAYLKRYQEHINATLASMNDALRYESVQTCKVLLEAATRRNVLLDLVAMFDEAKRQAHMAEFSDFTIAAYRLVTKFPSIAARYRKQYEQVLLDEYQDTSTTQAMVIAMLFHARHKEQSSHIAAVGDPYQAIYSFRGASSGAFKKFLDTFDVDAEHQFALTYTRRNAKLILQAANIITDPLRAQSTHAQSSEIPVQPLNTPEHAALGTIAVLKTPTQYQQIEAVVRFAKRVVEKPLAEHDTLDGASARLAVLFRSSTAMADYEEALRKAGLKVQVVGHATLFEHPAFQDVMALMKVANDHSDTSSLMRLLATPRFAMSTHDLRKLAHLATEENKQYVYQVCASAGLLPDDLPMAERAQAIQALMNEDSASAKAAKRVANNVFIADIMMRYYAHDANDAVVEQVEHGVSQRGLSIVRRVSAMLQSVQQAQSSSLQAVIRACVEALNVDIDTQVATSLCQDTSVLPPSLDLLGELSDLANSYLEEMQAYQQTSVHGFIAWLEAHSSVDIKNVTLQENVDVVLMTVHQSKGLEWPAVAVVNVKEGGFPSNQGDRLSIDLLDSRNRVYVESAKCALEDPTKVPLSVRVDADILTSFPHDATCQEAMHPSQSMMRFKNVEDLDAEVAGTRVNKLLELRHICESKHAPESVLNYGELGRVYQSVVQGGECNQKKERGKLLHDDERHLMYVALTRAKYAAMVSFAESNAMTKTATPTSKSKEKPSNFWTELAENSVLRAKHCVPITLRMEGGSQTENSEPSQDVYGYAVGDCAQELASLWSEHTQMPLETTSADFVWPTSLDADIQSVLQASKRLSNDKTRLERAMKHVNDINTPSSSYSLYQCAKQLVEDRDLMPQQDVYHDMQALRNRAHKILASARLNVTSLQRNQACKDSLMAIIRPIPRPQTMSANLGTRFHAWAEDFINALIAEKVEGHMAINTINEQFATLVRAHREKTMRVDVDSRELVAQLDQQMQQPLLAEHERTLLTWKKRLLESPWASRVPLAAELPIVAYIPEIGHIINGKLDAVFLADSSCDNANANAATGRCARYSIVDWKTGKRPQTDSDIEQKLRQLDWYRLLLAKITNVPLDNIDATLYYVSQADEQMRQLHATMKSEDQIFQELNPETFMYEDEDAA